MKPGSRVSIVLPSRSPVPVGGYKVVYEYANHLARRGWRVAVVHPMAFEPASGFGARLTRWWKARRYTGHAEEWIPWFDLDPRVMYLCIPHPIGTLPRADLTIATSWETAEWVAAMPENRRGKGFYLIQHFEEWSGDRDRVLATWTLPLKKLVIAEWLGDMVKSIGEDSQVLPNGLDQREFGIDMAPQERDRPVVSMLWHEQEWKGSKTGLAALEKAKLHCPDLEVELFSVYEPPPDLPGWIRFLREPSRRELRDVYNRSQIFLAPSLTEGFGLPPAEAMMCGAAVVLTDVGGHRQFASPGENCRMVPPGDHEAMAREIVALLGDPSERIRLALAGAETMSRFSWERSTDLLESYLNADDTDAVR